ncbi:MAG: DUF4142 domain-containing protein [Chitinophagaceae bacterium]|nr:DUF4142 domain-containing protein [Chitinophagaceae bacterium]
MKQIRNVQTRLLPVAFFIAAILGFSACGGTQKTTDSKDVAKEQNEAKFTTSSNENDAKFVVNAAEINLEEIKLGQLAQQNGMTDDIKALGKTMTDQHTQTLSDLTALAKQKVISIPASPTDNALDAFKKLNDKSAKYFDRAYADMMVSGHKDAIALFEKASAECTDANIKAWALATLPQLRMQLDAALASQSKLDKL